MPEILGRILCFLGIHDDTLLEATFGFGPGGLAAKKEGGVRKPRPYWPSSGLPQSASNAVTKPVGVPLS